MLDGLGLAESTPGPLIMVTEFVGFVGAYRNSGGLSPLEAGTLGAAITVWATFAPCFLWIFFGAPFIERIRNSRLLAAALTAITAAVVGVILNLAVWLGLHALFGKVSQHEAGPLKLLVPTLASIDPFVLVVAAIAFLGMRYRRWDVIPVIAAGAIAGLLYRPTGL
jgi:chromate transporter